MRLGGFFVGALAASMLLSLPAGARATTQVASDEALLARLSNTWMIAIERKDRRALEQILADDFVLQMPGDKLTRVTRRQEWLANAIAMDWRNFRYENLSVAVHGDQATVTSRLRFNVAPFPVELDSGVVDIWQKRSGRWQVTQRYLGESEMQLRIAFAAGAIAAIIGGLLIFAIVGIVRRLRRRSTSN